MGVSVAQDVFIYKGLHFSKDDICLDRLSEGRDEYTDEGGLHNIG